METRLQVAAILAAGLLFLLVLELVRRRRLMERYALLWLLSAVVLLALAIWTGGLSFVSDLVGVRTPSNALFAVAFGFVLVLLLHFSLVISALTDQSKILAQQLALLDQELRAVRARSEGDRAGDAPDSPSAEHVAGAIAGGSPRSGDA